LPRHIAHTHPQVGVYGYTFALARLPPLLVSLTMLLEPVGGALFGVAIGVASLPGVWTWVGGAVMLIGLAAVVVGADRRTRTAAAAAVGTGQEKGGARALESLVGDEAPHVRLPDHKEDEDEQVHIGTAPTRPTEDTPLLQAHTGLAQPVPGQ
jgi:hypothetical protein